MRHCVLTNTIKLKIKNANDIIALIMSVNPIVVCIMCFINAKT